MKASDLIKDLEKMVNLYGDFEVIFRDEYNNNTYQIKDILVKFSKKESDTYIFDYGLGKQIFVGEFVNTFGYSFYRYEDLNYVAIDVFYEILRWVQ